MRGSRGRRGLARERRPGPLIAVLAFAGMGASFMQTILIPMQSELPELLRSTREDTAWVITITLLVAAVCTPVSGKLGDMYGKRRVALVLLALLIAGSVTAAFATTVVPLIVGRGLQGTGLGVIPLGIAILRDSVPRARLASATALVSGTLGVGGAIGLPISAFVTEFFDWHLLFWIAAGIGVLSFVLYFVFVPASNIRSGGRFDYVGAVGLAIGLVALLLGVSKGNEWGWLSAPTLGCLVGGFAFLLVWGWFELRVSNPLVDIRVSARPAVLFTNIASIAMGFALFASSIVFPQLLQLPEEVGGVGLSLLQASFILMPSGLVMLAMSPVAGRLEKSIGAKPLFVIGSLVIAIGYLVAVMFPVSAWHVLVINMVIGVGVGLGYAAMPTLIMQAVPSNETASANGVNTLMRALGTSTAAAFVAAILAESTVRVDGVPVPTIEAFQVALVLGLIAALVCSATAATIPPPRGLAREHGALPEPA